MNTENKPAEEIAKHANSVVIDGIVYDIKPYSKDMSNDDLCAASYIYRLIKSGETEEGKFVELAFTEYDKFLSASKQLMIYALGKASYEKAFPKVNKMTYGETVSRLLLIMGKMKMV